MGRFYGFKKNHLFDLIPIKYMMLMNYMVEIILKNYKERAVIQYLDTAEEESTLIVIHLKISEKRYTHLEIHPSLALE